MKKYNFPSYCKGLTLLLFSFCSFSLFGQTTNYIGQSNKPTTTPTTNLGAIVPPAQNAPHNVNFVRTYSAQVPIQSERNMRNQPTEKVVVTTGYMDGLGRMIQSNMREASPSKKDIIQVANYDQYGRQLKQYLPFTKGNGGNYETNGLREQYLFYRNEPNIKHTNYAFIEADIENSPMARMNEVGNVGEHWKLENGHTRSATTRTNTAEDAVRGKWILNYGDCGLKSEDIYAAGELYVSEVKDEDNTHIQTFIDKAGKTILKRVEGEDREWLETYYIYDDWNRLAVILPPEMSKRIASTNYESWDYICQGDGAFKYNYDTRGRLIAKYTPGKYKFPTRIIYDQLDRPIFVQTPEQYSKKEWNFTKYDKFGRSVFSGLYTSPTAYTPNEFASVMQETVLFEERNQNENTHFYTHRSFQSLPGTYEIHTVTYYDDYEFLETHPDSINASFRFRTPPMNEAARPTHKTRGMATGSKVLLLQEDPNPLLPNGFQTSVIYYDEYGRPIQVQKENHKNGLDISYTKYDFAGKVLETVTKHETDVHEVKVRYEYTYDHVGRPKEVKQRIQTPTTSNVATANQDREKIISRYHYNELGQVTQKQLHSENEGVTFLQDVDFKYNVRGWLTHINDSELTDTRDVFGMELSYETGFDEVQHNGNISGVKWKSATNNVERSYGFAYDKLGRLKRANYHAKDQNTGMWTAENENYTVWDLNYDLDGNILSVKRNGLLKEEGQTKVFGLIDDLNYEYRRVDNRGKMLVGVQDRAELETASKDFKDGNQAGDDYEYNTAGSIIQDKNKGVSFEYNHLGRVNKILNTNNPNDKIDYLYDATGSKLQKTVVEGSRNKKIDYVNGFQYRNDTLDFFPMPEGRIVFKEGEYIPEYHFKDHLGNLRLAFQVTDQQNERYALTMETENAESEEKEFENVKTARNDQKEQKGHYSARLTNADKPILKKLNVEKGDKISALVFATNDPEIAQTDPTKAIDKAKKDVLLSLGSAAAGTLNPQLEQDIDIPLNPEVSPATTKTIKTPRVRVNLLDFVPVIRNLRKLNRAKKAKDVEPDSYHVPRGELVLQLRDSTDSLITEKRQKITISATLAWEKLTSDFTAEEDGELTVFIDNQDTEAVYLDELELRVERQPTLVITQEHHYYPFGMNMSGIERQGDLMYQFNGMIEKEQAFGLELYETPFRSYDAQLGRFWQVEPLADKYHNLSMYQFGYNNPISYNDPTGLFSIKDAWRSIRWGIKSLANKLGGGDGNVWITTKSANGRMENPWRPRSRTERQADRTARQESKDFYAEGRGDKLSGTQVNRLILLQDYYNGKMQSASTPIERSRTLGQINKFMNKLRRKGYTDGVAEQGTKESETTDIQKSTKLVSVTGGRIVNYNSGWQRISNGNWWVDDSNLSQSQAGSLASTKISRLFIYSGTELGTTYRVNPSWIIQSSQITIQGTGTIGATNDGNFTTINNNTVITPGMTYNLIGTSSGTFNIPANTPFSVQNLNNGLRNTFNLLETPNFFIGSGTFRWQVFGYEIIKFRFRDIQ